VTEFFDRYRAHDVDGMTDLCSINADFSYVPVEIWGKQRVLRGDGKVCTVGKPLWTGLIASFPNLSNTVTASPATTTETWSPRSTSRAPSSWPGAYRPGGPALP
jgi:hypothetical protein